MPHNFYLFLHLIGILLLTGFTFYAFAGPSAKTKKMVMILTGISSLIVLVSGFGMLGGMGFPGWIMVKLVAWLGLSAFSGIAYRRPRLNKMLILVSAVLLIGAVWAVVYKPF